MDIVCKIEVEEIECASSNTVTRKKGENKEERLSIQDRVRCLDEFNKPENANKNNRLGLRKFDLT